LNVVAGQPFVLTWTDAEGPVDIVLKFGDPKNLETVETLASMAFSNAQPAAEARVTLSGANSPASIAHR